MRAAGGLAVVMALGSPAAAQGVPELLVSTDWLQENLEGVVVLQAESRRDRYEAGHIPGARFLDMSRLMWDGEQGWRAEITDPSQIEAALEDAGVSDGDHIVVYSGSALTGARAFMTLEVMGLAGRVSMLDGGLGAWRAEGRPLSTDEPRVGQGSVTLSPRDDVVVSAEWILERLGDDQVALVDARPDDEYTGADGGMGGMANPGHIPGAAQMYWEELVESRAVPKLRDRDEVAALFAEAGADQGDTVVAYCMIGMRASFTYFTARLLGYDVKFYDGSWHDWGTRDDLPFVSGRSRR